MPKQPDLAARCAEIRARHDLHFKSVNPNCAADDIAFLLDQVEKMRKVQVALESLMSRLDNHFGGPERNGDWLEQEKARNVLAALDAEGGES